MTVAQAIPTATTLPFPIIGPTETEHRPWGSFTTLEEGPGYKIKRIEVNPGHRLSLQMHHHRSEHWIVLSGTAKVTCGEKIEVLEANQSTYVPQCSAHRLENPGVIQLVIIEVQNGEYLGEYDIIRFQDDYSRG
jgi:mannose-6-phosphate isomerase